MRFVSYFCVIAILFGSSAVPSAHASWQLGLEISIPDPAADTGRAINRLALGAGSTSTDGFDNQWDTLALSSASMNAYFPHPDYSEGKMTLWKDLRAEKIPKVWEIEVSTPLNGQARITWDGKMIPENIALKLVDEQTGNEVDMKKTGEYGYANSPSATRKFSIQASEITSTSGATPSQASSSPVSSGSGGGGGCGYIKGVREDRGIPQSQGSIALNLAMLFTPIFWLTLRRLVFFYNGPYIIDAWGKGSRRWHDTKNYPVYWGSYPSDPDLGFRGVRRGGWRERRH